MPLLRDPRKAASVLCGTLPICSSQARYPDSDIWTFGEVIGRLAEEIEL